MHRKWIVFTILLLLIPSMAYEQKGWYVEWEKIFPQGHAKFCQPIGDIDNDGKNEFVVGGYNDRNATIFKWNESLKTYEKMAIITYGEAYAGGAAIGDLMGDGLRELAIVWNDWNNASRSGCWVYKWDGDGFQKLQFLQATNFWIYYDCYIGDYNGDGKNELLLFGWVNYGPEIVIYGWNSSSKQFKQIAAWDDPDGTYYQTFIPTVYIADVDVDGRPEIICAPGQYLDVVESVGNEFNYTVIHKWKGMDIWTYGVAAGDINGNGIPEIVVGLGGRAHEVPTAYIFEYNITSKKYEEVWNKTWAEEKNVVEAVDIGDADNDGRKEACIGTNYIHIVGWNGVEYYEEAVINETYGILPGVHVGDCDNDGKNEILTYTLRETEGLPYRDWVFKYANSDATPPVIKIEKPQNYLYIMGIKIMPLPVPLIIGKMNGRILAYDNESDIEKVEIYIDGRITQTISSPPYEFPLVHLSGKHEITAVAYNNAENNAYEKLKFFALIK